MTRSRIARSTLVLLAATLTACATGGRPVIENPAVIHLSFNETKTRIVVDKADRKKLVQDGGTIVWELKGDLKPSLCLCALDAIYRKLFQESLPIAFEGSRIVVGPLRPLGFDTGDLPYIGFAMVEGSALPVPFDPTIRILP